MYSGRSRSGTNAFSAAYLASFGRAGNAVAGVDRNGEVGS